MSSNSKETMADSYPELSPTTLKMDKDVLAHNLKRRAELTPEKMHGLVENTLKSIKKNLAAAAKE